MKINIAIDGHAGSGKSTVAKIVAKRIGYNYIDTGSMYRCSVFLAIKHGLTSLDIKELIKVLEKEFNYVYKDGHVYLNNEDVTLNIRTPQIDELLPQFVPIKELRAFLISKQVEMGKEKGVIMDGRDIGSVVLPDAELKIFQTASLETRAKRRYEENLAKGIEANYQDILNNLEHRDYVDTNVSKALVKVKDAIELDTSDMSIEEVVDKIVGLAKVRIGNE